MTTMRASIPMPPPKVATMPMTLATATSMKVQTVRLRLAPLPSLPTPMGTPLAMRTVRWFSAIQALGM